MQMVTEDTDLRQQLLEFEHLDPLVITRIYPIFPIFIFFFTRNLIV